MQNFMSMCSTLASILSDRLLFRQKKSSKKLSKNLPEMSVGLTTFDFVRFYHKFCPLIYRQRNNVR